jgi:ABC-2 type transport system permease protein
VTTTGTAPVPTTGRFSLRYKGITAVARQEFRVRLRTGRWRWLLLAWLVTIAGFTVLLRFGLATTQAQSDQPVGPIGIPLFGGLMLFVLGLALLMAPALTAQSINGDRERGTLATVQVTRLSSVDIVLGKLVASWGTGLVFLALTLPFAVWAIAEGGVGIGRALIVLAVVALLVGVICAVAQGFSALLARGITSTLLSYLLVFALSVGTVVVFGLALVAFTVRPTGVPSGDSGQVTRTVANEPHPEDVWWLLAPNPFVVLADSAPAPPLVWDPDLQEMRPATALDPLSGLGYEVRLMRTPQREYSGPSSSGSIVDYRRDMPAVWPYGLGFDILLGVAAVWISVRRLRTPAHRVSRGVRIA